MITNYPITNGFLNDIDRFVNHALGAAAPLACRDTTCSVEERRDEANATDNPLGWNLRFELPGFKKDEVKLHVDEDFLSVTAETDDEARSYLGKVKRIDNTKEVFVGWDEEAIDDVNQQQGTLE